MRYLILAGFLFGILSAKAQKFSSEVFHEGYLVSSEQDTIRGQIKYDMETNIVQLIRNNVVKTYSSHNLFYFEIYDQIQNNYRQFYSIPYNVEYNYKIPIIFEVVYEGPLSLLAREAIVQQTVNSGYGYSMGSFVQTILKQTFFFLDKKGNIKQFSGKKADLLMIMRDKSSKVKDFIKKNHLRVDDLKDLIRITAYYNAL